MAGTILKTRGRLELLFEKDGSKMIIKWPSCQLESVGDFTASLREAGVAGA
jgi:hypothetical protein